MPVKTSQKGTQDKRTNMQSERERKAEVGSEKNGGFWKWGKKHVNEEGPKKGRDDNLEGDDLKKESVNVLFARSS